LEKAIRDAVASVDPNQPVFDVRPMVDRLAETWANARFATFLLMVFAGLALILALIGLYGVLAFNVLRRVREIGVRLALGATRGHIHSLVLGQGARLLALGLGGGALAAIASTRVLRSFLFEAESIDPFLYATVCGALVIAALAACWLPARRAAHTDPIITLREE
jgi:putative ABC transport system permease protein